MTFRSPYTDLGKRFPARASLHNHTFKRRATASPLAALSLYRQCGIPIVAITDHDRRIAVNGEPGTGQVPWIEEDWAHSYTDAVLIRGVEASFPADHVGVLGVAHHELSRKGGDEGYVQEVHERGGYAILNHPAEWNRNPAHVTDDANLAACDGIEIYNGGRAGKGPDRAIATELWDACLAAGLKPWALANSDCHMYDFTLAARPTNGYNVLLLDALNEAAVFDCLRNGRFYASNGLEIDRIALEGDVLHVEASEADRITFIGHRGRVLQESTGPAASYRIRGDERYVRAEAHADRPAYDGAILNARAWMQPTWLDS